jgi:hypothetical protein
VSKPTPKEIATLLMVSRDTDRDGTWGVTRGEKLRAKALVRQGFIKPAGISFSRGTLYVITDAGRRALSNSPSGE